MTFLDHDVTVSNRRRQGLALRLLSSVVHAVWCVAALGEEWSERAWQRRALGRLDDRMLKDIGQNRATRDREAAKPFWRA